MKNSDQPRSWRVVEGRRKFKTRRLQELPMMDFYRHRESRRRLLELIIFRALVLLLWLNLADRLGLLPARLGELPFLPLCNTLALVLTFIFLLLWRINRYPRIQLYLQIGADLALTTVLVACTRGLESPFVSFYLLIIIYCSLTLGRNGGMVGAARMITSPSRSNQNPVKNIGI